MTAYQNLTVETQSDIDDKLRECADHLNDGSPIQAIKSLRSIEALGLGLKDAKDVCDSARSRSLHPEDMGAALRQAIADAGFEVNLPSNWEQASTVLWELASALAREGDKRSSVVTDIAEQLDEAWGVV